MTSAWSRLVDNKERTHFLRFTPDGMTLLFGQDQGGNENLQLLRVPTAGGDFTALTNAPNVKHMWGALSRDGRFVAYSSNERNGTDFDLIVHPLVGTAPRAAPLQLKGHNEAREISPDGSKILVLHENHSFDTDLYLVEKTTGKSELLTEHKGDVRFEHPHFSKDGSFLWLASDKDRNYLNLATLDLRTKALSFVGQADADVERLEVAGDGKHLVVSTNVAGFSRLDVHEVEGKTLKKQIRTVDSKLVIDSMATSMDGSRVVFSGSGSTVPGEVFLLDGATQEPRRLTAGERTGVDETALIQPVIEKIKSFDELEVPAMVYKPRGAADGEKFPVVVYVHGGPESQARPLFNPLIQFMVGHGYMVIEPNVRGSTGYGTQYAHLDDVKKREDSVRDLGELNRWLRARNDVLTDRIAVLGGSYGGYMVLAALTLQPELWAAGCDIVGIANFETFLERTSPYRRALREAEYGSLSTDREFLKQISPIHKVAAIKAPLFVIHGANDPRVPVEEAEQIVKALRARQHKVEYMRFENEGHGLARRENRIKAYGSLTAFFDGIFSTTSAR